MNKKILGLIILLSFHLAVLCGCGGQEKEPAPDINTTAVKIVAALESREDVPSAQEPVLSEESKKEEKSVLEESSEPQKAEIAEGSSTPREPQGDNETPAQNPQELQETAPEPAPEKPETGEPVPYNPVSVSIQATAKCQAGGMTTTTDNLANLLSTGKITQEEYDSYYPYDGLGYYSVFVETDLNKASSTSGKKLGSEDGIANYIAEMMLLETEPLFYIEYAGIYTLNGTDFYEFRCYR